MASSTTAPLAPSLRLVFLKRFELGQSVTRACRGVLGCAVGAWVLLAQAQQAANVPQGMDGGTTLGLAKAYSHALEQDATVRAARAQAAGMAERLTQAKAQLYPNISLNASRYANDLSRTQPNLLGQTTTTQENYFSYSQTLQLRQPLYRPALGLGVDVARAQGRDANAELEREVQGMGVRVVEAYLQVLLSQEKESLLTAQEQLAVQQLAAAQKRFAGGQGIRTDIDEAQARIDLLVAQRLEASQTRQGALLQLQMLTQQPVSGVHALSPQALDMAGFAAQTPQFWMERAEANSPEVQSALARLEAARLDVKRAEASHKPTLDAIVQLSRSGSESVTSIQSSYTNRQVGLQFNLPLYAGGGIQSAVRQALAEQTRQEEVLESVRRDLGLRVQREWRGVTEGVLRSHAMARAVESADKMVVSVKRSYEGGLRTVLDVLNAEQQAQQARRDLGEARLLYVASRMRLLALAGELDAQAVQGADGWFCASDCGTMQSSSSEVQISR